MTLKPETNKLKTENKELKKSLKRLQNLELEVRYENEKLREQIEHANRLIKWVQHSSWSCDQEEDDFDRYIKKWNVK